MKKYATLFFDLDRTLWDFDANSAESLTELLEEFDLLPLVGSYDDFHRAYRKNNERLWADYRDGNISKPVLSWTRFSHTFQDFGLQNEELARLFGQLYLEKSQRKRKMMPGTLEILNYLKPAYKLFLVTNGFEEVQKQKVVNCQLDEFFEGMITSEEAGVQKPDPAIFRLAMARSNSIASECLMIGDDPEVDIRGAASAGIDQVFLNSRNENREVSCTYEIRHLLELKKIL